MIKEFWQEQREEKKRQKQLKRQNKKAPKTKEQIAYKVFGILFTLFLIFGSIGFACSNVGDWGTLDWVCVWGITEEMSQALSDPVDSNIILTECVLSSADWEACQQELQDNGIDIVREGEMDAELLDSVEVTHQFCLSSMSLGALVSEMIGSIGGGNTSELLSFKLFENGGELYLSSVCFVDLSKVVAGSTLPIVYVQSTSRLTTHNERLCSLNPEYQINMIEDSLNDEIIEVINRSSLIGLENYTNSSIVSQINTFSSLLQCTLTISDGAITFKPKTN